jgi:hypothetical protein
MENLLPLATFSTNGELLLITLTILAGLVGISGVVNIFRKEPIYQLSTTRVLVVANSVFVIGFLWICWFHYQIYLHLPLELPGTMATWLNNQLDIMNSRSTYALPLLDTANPPRYMLPVWIENEKYYFWFMCYGAMSLVAHFRMQNHRFRAALHILLGVQVTILLLVANPFKEPLPQFFAQIAPWFNQNQPAMAKIGSFMKLYPKMIFYYNAEYMWLHPPMLFVSYACITISFVTSCFMLVKRDIGIEKIGYDFAKLGYFMLTLGMLLGYPWALKAWGPNWWWDPKICSSIMMWAIYSTYLHTRLYANKPGMWYFSSALGILCFLAMIFTFLTSFFFPGEHTFQ